MGDGKRMTKYEWSIEYVVGFYRDNGQENRNYYVLIGHINGRVILGFYRDNGKENGSYYLGYHPQLAFVLSKTMGWFRYITLYNDI